MTAENPTYPAKGQTPTGPDQLTRFFDWIRRSGLVRGSERWLAGVCGSVAAKTGLDPMIVRGIVVVLGVLGAPVVLLYAIGWALLPNVLGRIHAEEALRGRFEPAIIAIIALLVLTIAPFNRGIWWDGVPGAWGMPDWITATLSVAWGLAVAAGIVWLIVYLVRRRQAGTTPGGPAQGGPALGGPAPYGSAPYGSTPYGSAPYGSAQGGPTPPASPDETTITTPPPPAVPPVPADLGPLTADSAAATQPTEAFPQGAPNQETPSDTSPPAAYSTQAPSSPAFSSQEYPTQGSPTHGQAAAWARQEEQNRLRADQNRAWQDQNRVRREQQLAQQSERAARWRARRPSAATTTITLGLALLAGAIAYLGYSGGEWSTGAFVFGLAMALGLVAVGIIVAGIRGRESGALGWMALLAVVALVWVGVAPQGTQFTFAGNQRWNVVSSAEDSPTGYAMVAGAPTVDLSDLDTATGRQTNGQTVDVWLGFGVTTLVLPARRPVEVEVHLLAGVVGSESTGGEPVRGGVLIRDVRTVNGTDARSVPRIRVWSLAGQVKFIGGSDAGSTLRSTP